MITGKLKSAIEKELSKVVEKNVTIESFHTLSGGDINKVYKVKTATDDYCVKVNSAKKFPKMFAAEAHGLALLSSANSIKVPETLALGGNEDDAFLIMEYIPSVEKKDNYWQLLGEGLAKIHQTTENRFGLDHDNYIGSLKQYNEYRLSWAEFFVEMRLFPQMRLAYDKKLIGIEVDRKLEKIANRLIDIFDEEVPSLLHGDLWNGNVKTDGKGEPFLYDPAVYYGHREMDIAMTYLFGGFDSEFYHHYNNAFPLEKGWEARIKIWNLYPLFVHLNLFGHSYLPDIHAVLNPFF